MFEIGDAIGLLQSIRFGLSDLNEHKIKLYIGDFLNSACILKPIRHLHVQSQQ